MKYRKDIHEFLTKLLPDSSFKRKEYRFYEQNGILYQARIDNDDKKTILFYEDYSLLWFKGGEEIKEKIIKKFNVEFSKKDCDIICKCGESKKFSAFYGDYTLKLKCNECSNLFTAYSG